MPIQPSDPQPLPTTDKYGREVKVKVIKRRKKSRPCGDNTMSPFERFSSFGGSKVTSF